MRSGKSPVKWSVTISSCTNGLAAKGRTRYTHLESKAASATIQSAVPEVSNRQPPETGAKRVIPSRFAGAYANKSSGRVVGCFARDAWWDTSWNVNSKAVRSTEKHKNKTTDAVKQVRWAKLAGEDERRRRGEGCRRTESECRGGGVVV